VVKANILAAKSNKIGSGEVINIRNGKNISINNVVKLIGNNVIHRKPVDEAFANLADVSKAKKLLDWEPVVQLEDWIISYNSKIGLN
jgi:UDP-glucuronate decarboxylase